MLRHTVTSGSAKFGEVAVLRKTFSRLGLATACDTLRTLCPGEAVKMAHKAKSKRFDFPYDLTLRHVWVVLYIFHIFFT